MLRPKWIAAIVVVLVLAFLVPMSCFVVDEGQQAVITQFGDPVGEPVTEAGLHFKMPFVQDVHRFEKRLLAWDGDPNRLPTRDKTFIFVDVTARWRITNALQFYKSVVTVNSAQTRLDDILDGATRSAISSYDLIESIRSDNRQLPRDVEIDNEQLRTDQGIRVGRRKIQEQILANAAPRLENFGVTLVDVRIKQINYSEQVAKKVSDRMISERHRIAEKFRSEGLGKRAEIDGQRERELKKISSEAYREAQEIRGKADAEAAAIFAEAYGADAEFYEFTTHLEVLRESLSNGTDLILSTDGDLFKLLKGDPGKK
jgi:membrane protease subunit HflC